MECDKCGVEKSDALRRMAPHGMKSHWYGDTSLALDPVLCSLCCCEYPGRGEWMRESASWLVAVEAEGAQ